MFTGIVQAVGTVKGVQPRASGLRIEVDPLGWGFRPGEGDSISVDGCCLTVVDSAGSPDRCWRFDAVPETLAKTTLGNWQMGKPVNLEHAATASTFMGGHVVQGHVDGVGTILNVRQGADWRIRLRPGGSLMEFMVPKGSVALNGVSLTLAEVSVPEGWIEVALIPATLEKSNLAGLRAGDGVNVEADSMAKTMIHWLKNYAPSMQSADARPAALEGR
ncbi:MAG: riboflavin synthase [Planctomycetes bacterium]|nr:riboflavin synthase [Planctomycetota bacterium]